MAVVTMKNLLESGVHFGHQVKRWDPRMKKYIFAERNGIHIIDLQKTIQAIKEAYDAVQKTVGTGKSVLFVGTKKQAQTAIQKEAERCEQFYVNNRWLGGMLTNFSTIKKSIQRLKKIEKMEVDGTFESLTKKEIASLQKEKAKLEKNLGGIKEMKELPGAIFVIDTRKEAIAVAEAQKLGIPIVAVVDTNCNPEGITYPIPGNDDAIRSISLFTQIIANAVVEAGAAEGLKIIENLSGEESEEVKTDAAPSAEDDEVEIDPATYTAADKPKAEEARNRGSRSDRRRRQALRGQVIGRTGLRQERHVDIKASDIKDLREKTGAGMMDCKKALVEAKGDFAGAEKILREWGMAGVEKRAGRATNEGKSSSRKARARSRSSRSSARPTSSAATRTSSPRATRSSRPPSPRATTSPRRSSRPGQGHRRQDQGEHRAQARSPRDRGPGRVPPCLRPRRGLPRRRRQVQVRQGRGLREREGQGLRARHRPPYRGLQPDVPRPDQALAAPGSRSRRRSSRSRSSSTRR